MENLILNTNLVSAEWLHANIHAANLVILDASMPKVTDTESVVAEKMQIPGARFFDIKKQFSDTSGEFPNTCPSDLQFTEAARVLGIQKDSAIVIYDDKGIYSSPRAWWLFKTFGHDNVAILDGGLPEWKRQNYETEVVTSNMIYNGDFEGRFNPLFMRFFEDIKTTTELIVDARSQDRFDGLRPEPRKGLRTGHIPNAVNLPFGTLLNDGVLKSKDELNQIFKALNSEGKAMTFSCGSGITACILALAASECGYDNLSVYDGSWTEYGSLTSS